MTIDVSQNHVIELILHHYQLRDLVDACIKTNPADRPDIQTVYGVAKEMYEHTRGQS